LVSAMHDDAGQHDPLAALRALLAGEYDRWEAWTGVSGLLYARRRKTSPPAVIRGDTPVAVAEQIRTYERGKR
jgi:hypothetical protein